MDTLKEQASSGAFACAGMIAGGAIDRCAEIVARLEVAGLETLRVLFTEQHGVLRGKTIVASALPALLADSMAASSTLLLKDTSHRTAFPVWPVGSDAAGGRGYTDGTRPQDISHPALVVPFCLGAL